MAVYMEVNGMTVCQHKVNKRVGGPWDWQMEKAVVQQSVSFQKQQKLRFFSDCKWLEPLSVFAVFASYLSMVGDQSSAVSSGCVTKRQGY